MMESARIDKRNRMMLVFAVVSILFLSGCSSMPFIGSSPKAINYRVGYDGIIIEPHRANPDEVFEKDPFQMTIFVKNLGSNNVETGAEARLTVTYNDYYLILTDSPDNPAQRSFPLHRRDQNYPLGDQVYEEYFFTAKNLDSLREEVDTDITFNVCYPYSSELTVSTCVNTKTSPQDEGISACKIEEHSDRSGQGAPVSISRIVPSMTTYDANTVKPQYRIYLENKGEGYVVDKTRPDVCTDPTILNSTNINRVTVSAWLSGKELECFPKTIKVLDGKENIAKCEVRDVDLPDYLRNQKSYVAPLTVRADYGYIQVYNEKVNIKRIEEIIRPVVRCGSFEVLNESGECESKCSYCARGKGSSADCKISPGNQYSIGSDFSCRCTKTTCNQLAPTGECGFGFCPGNSYCCNINECTNKGDGTPCGDNYVCIGEQCSTDTTKCWWQKGQYDGNYSCRWKNQNECNTTTIVEGLCPLDVNYVCCKPNGV